MPPIPTPFPIPTPDPIAPTINADVFWTYDAFSPSISMAQSVWLWANQYNMLTYAMTLAIVMVVINWMFKFVIARTQRGSEDV